jgi:hypothetical protein
MRKRGLGTERENQNDMVFPFCSRFFLSPFLYTYMSGAFKDFFEKIKGYTEPNQLRKITLVSSVVVLAAIFY